MDWRLRFLLLASFLLAGLIGLELAHGTAPAHRTVPRPAVSRLERPVNAHRDARRGEPFAAVALARPLFSPNRRPPMQVAGPPTERQGLPRLSGVVIDGPRRLAFFAGPEIGRTIVAEAGAALGRWTVVAIAADAVTLLGPDGEQQMQPRFASEPAATVATTVTQQPNRLTEAMRRSHHALLELLENGHAAPLTQ